MKRLGTNKIFSARRKRDCRTETGDPLRKVVKKKILKPKPKVVLKENPANVSIDKPLVSENTKGEKKIDSIPEAKTCEKVKPKTIGALHKKKPKVKVMKNMKSNKRPLPIETEESLETQKEDVSQTEELQNDAKLCSESKQNKGKIEETTIGKNKTVSVNKIKQTNQTVSKKKVIIKKGDAKSVKSEKAGVSAESIDQTDDENITKKVKNKEEASKEALKSNSVKLTEKARKSSDIHEISSEPSIRKKGKSKLATVETNANLIEIDNLKEQETQKNEKKAGPIKKQAKKNIKAQKVLTDQKASSEPSSKKGKMKELKTSNKIITMPDEETSIQSNNKGKKTKSVPNDEIGTVPLKGIIPSKNKKNPDIKEDAIEIKGKGKGKGKVKKDPLPESSSEEKPITDIKQAPKKKKEAGKVKKDPLKELSSEEKPITDLKQAPKQKQETGKVKKDPLPALSSEEKPITDTKQAPKRKQEALTEKPSTQKKTENKKAKTVVSKKRTRANAPSTRSINTKGVEHSPINKVPIKKKQPVKAAAEETLAPSKPQTEGHDKTMEPKGKGVKRITNRTLSKDTEMEAKRVKVDDEVSFVSPKVVKQKAPPKKTKVAPVESGSPVMKLIQGVGRRLGLLKK